MIPDFQTIMLPLLKWSADDTEHSLGEARQHLGVHFKLSDQDLQEKVPSGTQSTFTNRVAWAKVYLNKAGLLVSTKRGSFKITPEGHSVLKDNIERITIRYLSQFAAFQEFQNKKSDKGKENSAENESQIDEKTPEEKIGLGYKEINDALSADVLEKVKSCSPTFFEKLVVDLLIKMGYGGNEKDAGKAIGKSGDGGIDGVISEDKLGLDVIYIQAKRYTENNVQRPDIQKFIGALASKGATKGVFITTSAFSSGALECASGNYRIVLIDGEKLSNLMIEYNVGVSTKGIYEIKGIDIDYYEE